MSLKKIEQVKKDKGYKLFDLIIYGVVLAVAAATLIAVFATRNTDPLSGVRVFVNAEQIFEYEFGGTPVFSDKGEATVEVEETDGGITLTVRTAGGGLNVVYIDKNKKSVKMTEANCKGGQCKYFPEMTDNSGFIFCSPHGVKVEPLTKNLDGDTIPF